VPQDQRQGALTDGAESYENQPSPKYGVFRLVHFIDGFGFSAGESSIILPLQEYPEPALAEAARLD
jgi:hypothetical protein